MKKRYLKAVSLLDLAKAWKMNDIPVIPNKDKGKQLFLRLTSSGGIHKQGRGSYVTEDELQHTDIVILGNKYFKLI